MTHELGDTVRFQLLGPLMAWHNTNPIELGTPRERRLLTALLAMPGHWILRERLIDWVWDDRPPNDPRALDEVAKDLRTRLRAAALDKRLVSRDGSCRLDVPARCVDAHRMAELLRGAGAETGVRRKELLLSAVRLSHGEPLAGLSGDRIGSYRRELSREYRKVEVMLCQSDVRSNAAPQRLADLDRLYRTEPMDSNVAGLYICALHYAGNPVAAQEIYHDHRKLLSSETGIDVPVQLARLYQRLLTGAADIGPEADTFLGGKREKPAVDEPGEETVPDPSPENRKPASEAPQIVNNTIQSLVSDYTVFGFGGPV